MGPSGVMFHHFHGPGHPPGQGSIDAAELDAIIDAVGRERILPARAFLSRAITGHLRDDDLCLTFDDNLRCQFDVALPVVRARGITAFWFVYSSVLCGAIERIEVYRRFRTSRYPDVDSFYRAFFERLAAGPDGPRVREELSGFVPARFLPDSPFYSDADRRFRFVRDEVLGRARYEQLMDAMIVDAGLSLVPLADGLWMDAPALRSLHAEGHVVGMHSHTHPTKMEYLSAAEQRREYGTNRDLLTVLLGTPPTTVSHPCNSYSAETLRILADLGIRVGFRADVARAATSPLELPREDHANLLGSMRGRARSAWPQAAIPTVR